MPMDTVPLGENGNVPVDDSNPTPEPTGGSFKSVQQNNEDKQSPPVET